MCIEKLYFILAVCLSDQYSINMMLLHRGLCYCLPMAGLKPSCIANTFIDVCYILAFYSLVFVLHWALRLKAFSLQINRTNKLNAS